MGPYEILRRYFPPHEQERILAEVHDEVAQGNYEGHTTIRKILRAGLWWPTLHNDVLDYVKSYDMFVKGQGSHHEGMRCR